MFETVPEWLFAVLVPGVLGVATGLGIARLLDHWPGPFRTRKRPVKVGDRVRYVGKVDKWSPRAGQFGTVVKRRPGWHETVADVVWDEVWDERDPARPWPASPGEIERVA